MDNNDFKDFKDSKIEVPKDISDLLKNEIHSQMTPKYSFVTTVVLISQSFFGLLSLLICSQFGVGIGPFDIYHTLHMALGHYTCSFICGAIFIVPGMLVTKNILESFDQKHFDKYKLAYISFSAFISLIILNSIGTPFDAMRNALWLVGGISVSYLLIQFQNKLKA